MADTVKMVAYSDLSDAHAGQVEKGEEFETTPELARQYAKAQWAGPPGEDAREIQMAVAAEEIEKRAEAKKHAQSGRKLFRNLSSGSFERGNAAAVGVLPQQIGPVDDAGEQRTNEQGVGDTAEGDRAEAQAEDAQEPAPQEARRTRGKKS
jgi:hypothetical protein